MSSESTPLIQRVDVAPPRQRYPHYWVRRICTGLLVTACIVVVLLFLLLPDVRSRFGRGKDADIEGFYSAWPEAKGLPYKELQTILSDTPDEDHAKEWSRYYTAGPHLAGKNLSQAEWTRDRWHEFGVPDANIVSYDVYLNYPLGHRLALLEGKEYKVAYEAKLEEDVLEEDHTSGLKDRVPTFHGYSANGNVTAQYVFVNYGTFKDFEDLQEAGIPLKGKIAFAKYGGIFRGLKAKRAEELGMIGIVIYTDPGDDPIQSEDPDEAYPNGPARNPSSVQRGSMQFISTSPGDPTTPGYPSKPGAPRVDPAYTLPSIPSIPISYLDALPFLKSLNGHGPNASAFGERWHYGGLGYKGVHYNVGPSPEDVTLNLVNEQNYTTTPLWNVIGVINGTLSDEVIVLGNHRDAWIAGGAADPNSGSAALNEVARGLGKALKAGWKPLRTIVLASWDGEEYGLIGSTEWVEEYIPWLSHSAVAYVNVDVGTSGSEFGASAAPLLDNVILESTQMVQSPNQTTKGTTIGDLWNGVIKTMGSGSDFTAFQDFAGIPCIDMGFGPNPSLRPTDGAPTYHYHSNYDSFDWMDRFGDPGWHYHVAVSKLWGLLTAKLVETPVLPFSAVNYAKALKKYLDGAKAHAESSSISEKVSFKKMGFALEKFLEAAHGLDKEADHLSKELEKAKDLSHGKRKKLYRRVRHVNKRYQYLERQFLYAGGLDERSWFKHTVFAPGKWTGYAGATYPGIIESIDDGSVEGVKRWEGIISGQIFKAAGFIKH